MSQIGHRRALDRELQRRYYERKKQKRVGAVVGAVKDPETPPLTKEEWRRCLETAVRKGSVQAMKLWREEFGRNAVDGDDPFSGLDA